MQLRFVTSESAFAYFEALQGYLEAHGCPVAFYSDKHSVFRVARKEAKGGQGMTQFGRALAELNIEILCANSSQAKGRVERVNRTLQDRLVKELRMAGISDIAAANAFLPGFIERFNARFAVAPACPDDRHRPLNIAPDRLRDILCHREQRYVGQQLTLSYERKRIILVENETTAGLAGQYVDTYAFADGRLEVRWKGLSLPFTVFDKDQRVTHAAIVENKRLGEVLAFIKSQQDQRPPPRPKTNSERIGYRKKGRTSPGRKSFVDRMVERRQSRAADGSVGVAGLSLPTTRCRPLPQPGPAECLGLLRPGCAARGTRATDIPALLEPRHFNLVATSSVGAIRLARARTPDGAAQQAGAWLPAPADRKMLRGLACSEGGSCWQTSQPQALAQVRGVLGTAARHARSRGWSSGFAAVIRSRIVRDSAWRRARNRTRAGSAGHARARCAR